MSLLEGRSHGDNFAMQGGSRGSMEPNFALQAASEALQAFDKPTSDNRIRLSTTKDPSSLLNDESYGRELTRGGVCPDHLLSCTIWRLRPCRIPVLGANSWWHRVSIKQENCQDTMSLITRTSKHIWTRGCSIFNRTQCTHLHQHYQNHKLTRCIPCQLSLHIQANLQNPVPYRRHWMQTA